MSTRPEKIILKGEDQCIKYSLPRAAAFTTCQPGTFALPGASGELVVNADELNSASGSGSLKMIVLEDSTGGNSIFSDGASDTSGYIYSSGNQVPVAVLQPGCIVECLLDSSVTITAVGTALCINELGKVRLFTGSTTTATEMLIGYAMEAISSLTNNVTVYVKTMIA